MPVLLRWLAVVGTIAMLWVGGHILLVGADTLGWHWPYGVVHHAEEAVAAGAPFAAGALAWLTNTLGSAIAGVLVGAVLVALAHLLPRRGHRAPGVTQGAEDH
jgi:predicted DNA repair protein MutK